MAGWIFATLFAAHTVLGVILPRLEKESAIREAGRGWHYMLGLAIAACGLWLMHRWRRDGFVIAPGSLPPALSTWHSMVALSLTIIPLLEIPLGFLNAWGEGRVVHLANLAALPTLMAQNRAIWQFAGYFHSALGTLLVFVSFAGLTTAAYAYLRYRKGLLDAFPPSVGALVLVKAVVFIYAVNSFRDRERGFVAGCIFLAIVALFWIAGSLMRADRPRTFAPADSRTVPLALGTATLVLLAIFAGFIPYLLFKVTPVASGVVVKADPAISWHIDRKPGFAPEPETEFERTTAMETYKWCEFCHVVKAGAQPLVGPNLHNIFGQVAGTVPNFYYSPAMAEAGRRGLVWNDQTIAKFIADPQKFVPGTTMHISSGPVTDPKVRQAVVAILKRRTQSNGPQ